MAAGSAAVRRGWSEVAPAYAHLLTERPAAVLGMLSNAAIHLDNCSGADLGRWLDGMASLAHQVSDIDRLRALGQLLAWRAGAAHFRLGALAAAAILPDDLAHAACALAPDEAWSAFRAGITADPWHGLSAEDAQRGRIVGAFTGLGGEFPQPPELRAAGDLLLVRSGERVFQLIADRYGAVLHSAAGDDFNAAPPSAPLPPGVALRGQNLSINGFASTLDLPGESIRLACTGDTVAACSRHTHTVRVWPLR
jgi:hypothetical protein